MAIWDERSECRPREELQQLQLERLQSTLNRVYKNVALYRRLFDRMGIVPEDIGSLQDFRSVPFTSRQDLQDNYPYGLFAVPLREVVRIHTATDTTDTPTVIGYTEYDLKTWSDLVARFLTAGAVTPDDVIQVSFHYGLFTGAFGLHHGAERLGASVIPASSGHTATQIRIMQDYRTTVLVSTPGYALILADTLDATGIDPKTLMLRKGLFGGEIWSEETRTAIQERLYIDALDNYGVSEIMGPGIAGECQCRDGLHVCEDHVLPEVIDPRTGAPVPEGECGELVLTTLTREAFPLLRYRTGDITRLDSRPCPCGRTLVRMQRVAGRSDDVILIKGVAVVPGQIEKILAEIEGCEPQYQVIARREHNRDILTVNVAVSEHVFFDEVRRQEAFRDTVARALRGRLRVAVDVHLMERASLGRETAAAGTVVDTRTL